MSSILVNMRVSKVSKQGNNEVVTLSAPNATLIITVIYPEDLGQLKAGQLYNVTIEQDLHEGPPKEAVQAGRMPARAGGGPTKENNPGRPASPTADKETETGPARNKVEPEE